MHVLLLLKLLQFLIMQMHESRNFYLTFDLTVILYMYVNFPPNMLCTQREQLHVICS